MKSENRNYIFARKGLPVTTPLFALTFSVCLGVAPHAYASVEVGDGAEADADAVAVGDGASAHIKSIAVGRNANAEGNNAVAVGDSASADGIAVAIGNQAVASGAAAVAMGNYASAKEMGSVAIGNHASADLYAVAMGYSASAETQAVAVGVAASASQYSSAFGLGANAAGEMATAIGAGSRADGDGSFAAAGGQANEDNSIAIGDAEASSDKTIAIGSGALANDELAISIGSDSKAEGYLAVTMGSDAKAYGLASMALGGNATADDGGIAIGHYSNAIDNGVAIGDNSTANGVRAIGLGSWAEAHGYNSASFGAGAYAMGDSALALGSGSRAVGDYSFAAAGGQASQNSIAIGNSETTSENSIAIGFNSSAGEPAVLNRGGISGYSSNMGASAIAIGDSANAQGTNSLAIGSYTYAAAEDATALGNGAMANGWGSLALGSQASVNWGDDYAIAIGDSSAALAAKGIAVGKNAEIQAESAIALGDNAIVSGWNSDSAIAIGSQSGAEGEGAIALGSNAYASGKGALALGIGSYADREAGAEGFVPSTANTSQREAILATTSTEGAVSIGRAENGLLRQITGLAAGTEDTDAVNVAQLKASHELNQQQIRDLEGLAEAPITFSGDTGSTDRKLGEELAVTGDGNVVVSASGAGLGLSLNKNIQLGDEGSLAVGTAVHSSHGYAIGSSMLADGALVVGSTLLDGDGLNMGGKKITSLVDGTEDTDAATVGQVNSAVADVATGVQGDITNITNNINSLEQEHSTLANTPITFSGDTGSTERKLGEELTVKGDGNIVTTADNEGLSLSLNKDIKLNDGSVTIGDTKMDSSGFAVGAHSFTAGGLIVGDINITEGGINAGGSRITNVGEGTEDTDAATLGQVNDAVADVTGGIQVDITNITEGLAGLEQEHTALANTPITFSGDTGSTERKLGEELAVTGDGNVVTTASDEGLLVGLADNLDLGSNGSVTTGNAVMSSSGFVVGANGLTEAGLVVGSVNITDSGIDAGGTRISNLAEGVADTDAATVGQVKAIEGSLNKGIGFAGDNGAEVSLKLGETMAITGGADVDETTEGNIAVVADADKGSLEIKLAESIDLGADGSVTTGSTTVSNNGVSVGSNHFGSSGLFVGGITVDAGSNVIRGLSNTVLDPSNMVSGQAATEDQLRAIASILGIAYDGSGNTIEYNGNSYSNLSDVLNDLDWSAVGGTPGNGSGISDGSWNVADEVGSTEIANGDTVTVAGDANIKVQQSAKENGTGSNVSIELAKDIEVESVTAKNIKAEEVKAESFVVEGGPSMSKDGIDAGGKRITNVARGVEASDAATVGQVNELRGSMDFEFKSMRRDMRVLDHKTRAGIAAAMATASLPQAKRPGESIVSVGGGTWRGETGLAIGLSATSDNGKWTLNLSGNTTSRGDHGAAVGVGYQFR